MVAGLSKYPPEAIRQGVADMVETMKNPAYKIEMGSWVEREGGHCEVCLAGAVLCSRYGREAVEGFSFENAPLDQQKIASFFNRLRLGHITIKGIPESMREEFDALNTHLTEVYDDLQRMAFAKWIGTDPRELWEIPPDEIFDLDPSDFDAFQWADHIPFSLMLEAADELDHLFDKHEPALKARLKENHDFDGLETALDAMELRYAYGEVNHG